MSQQFRRIRSAAIQPGVIRRVPNWVKQKRVSYTLYRQAAFAILDRTGAGSRALHIRVRDSGLA